MVVKNNTVQSDVIDGIGLGLRTPYLKDIITSRPKVKWFEILADNFFNGTPQLLSDLETLRSLYPCSLHSVSLSIAGTDPLDRAYLRNLKKLAQRIQPTFISDHLCWTSIHGIQLHTLMPLPYTEATLTHVSERISVVQEVLGTRILIENIAVYANFMDATMSEGEFLAELTKRSGCGLLVDLSNLIVNQTNVGTTPTEILKRLPTPAIGYCHIGGFKRKEACIVDTHAAPIDNAVLEFVKNLDPQMQSKPLMIEWDEDLPSFTVWLDEYKRIKQILRKDHEESERDPGTILSRNCG
jgi:uncharacterized protein (UPF0276 family)